MTAEERNLHPLEVILLSFLGKNGKSTEKEILERSGLPDEGSYRRAVEWLLSRGLVREVDRTEREFVRLGPVGRANLDVGSTPETALLRKLTDGVRTLREAQEDVTFDRGRWGSAFGALLKDGLVRKDGDGVELVPGMHEDVFSRVWKHVYLPLREGEKELEISTLPEDVAGLVRERSPKRGRGKAEFQVVTVVERSLEITGEGRKALEEASGRTTIGAITPEVLSKGSWKDADFRKYALDIPPARIHTGRLHPYKQFLDTVRKRFVSLGFTEMEGSVAESEFWNNDALFMPQFHPARDIHDVYHLREGYTVPPPPRDLLENVASAHENGEGTGGRGWGYPFDRKMALKAVMRSQGTALSARTLASGPEIPGKYFGMARCFRYDQVDSTHLPDFFQVEGIVLGRDMTLRHLMGLLGLFAREIAGARDYKFLPGYFPFTEPSVEMHILHPRLGWIEGGGAGLFRPEVRLPLGIDVPVIAWGLGLDRMAMLAMGLDDIRDLVTPDLSRLRSMKVKPDRLLTGREE